MRRWTLIVVGVLIAIPAITIAVGIFLPRDHVAAMAIELAAPPGRVWEVVSDFQNTPTWRADITAVRMDPAGSGPVRFTESSSQGDIPFEIVSQEPPTRQVVRVVDDDQPFGGTWTWELQPDGTGTRLSLIEKGFIKNPLFRVISSLFFRPTDSIDAYLRSLAAKLGETAVPRLINAPAAPEGASNQTQHSAIAPGAS